MIEGPEIYIYTVKNYMQVTLIAADENKVIIEKSRGEVSLMGQDTIEKFLSL